MRFRNTSKETHNFSLSKSYNGIGKTLCVLAKSTTDDLPSEIALEKEVRAAISKGRIVIVGDMSIAKEETRNDGAKIITGKDAARSFLGKKKDSKKGKGV